MPLVLNTGIGGTWSGVSGTNAGASPQGPATAAQAGFGVSAGGGSGRIDGKTGGVLSVGTLALAALIYIWWSLPR